METLLVACSYRGAESQEGVEIAQAWIADLKVYPVCQCPNDSVHAGEDSGGLRGRFVKNFAFLLIILQGLLADQMGSF